MADSRPGKNPPTLYTKADEGWKPTCASGAWGFAGYDLELATAFRNISITSDGRQQAADAEGSSPQGWLSRPNPPIKDIGWPKGVTAHRPYHG